MQSVALRIGRSWRWDPDVLARLLQARAGGVERTLREIRDTLEVLVGGRNIAADASEDALFPVLYDLLRALGDLHRGGRRKAIIGFRDEPWELVIERRADEGRLSFYGAGATRVVAARDASVGFPELIRSVAGAAATLADELEGLCPSWHSDPYLRSFRDAANALLSSPPRPLGDLPTAPAGSGAGRPAGTPATQLGTRGLRIDLAPDLTDEGLRGYAGEHAYDLHSLLFTGEVGFRTRQTTRRLVGGYPFLAAESLVAATESALGAIEGEPGRDEVPLADGRLSLSMAVDGAAGRVRLHGGGPEWGRALTCTVPQFAAAALTAAQELADTILERNPAHRENRRLTDLLSEVADLRGWLDDLATSPQVPCGAITKATPRSSAQSRPGGGAAVTVHTAGLRLAWAALLPGLDTAQVKRCGAIVTAVAEGRLLLFDSTNGARVGDLAVDEAPVVSVASASGLTIVGRADGELLCVRPGEGVLWASELGNASATAALTATGRGADVVTAGGDGAVRMFDARTGRPRWRFNARRAASYHLTMDDQRIYAAADDRSLYALASDDGRQLWRLRCGGGFTAPPTPLPGGGILAVTGDGVVPEGRVIALDAADGRTLWETRIGASCARPGQVDADGFLVCTRQGDRDSLVRLDLHTGRELWRASWACLGIADATRPLIVDGLVCVKDDVGVVRAFDARSGLPAWSIDLAAQGRIDAVDNLDLAAGRGVLFAATDRLVVLSADTGDELSEAGVRIQGRGALLSLGRQRLILAHAESLEAWSVGRYLGLVRSE